MDFLALVVDFVVVLVNDFLAVAFFVVFFFVVDVAFEVAFLVVVFWFVSVLVATFL